MERINLSDFKPMTKYDIINGIFNKVKRNLEGKQLEFFGVNEDTIKQLTEKKISSNEIEFLYDIIPIISNVNCDIEFEEFEKMCKCPSPQFADYIGLLMKHFVELYTTGTKLNNLESEITNTINDLGIELPKQKTKEEQLEELYLELNNAKDDKAKRKEILKQITKLECEE